MIPGIRWSPDIRWSPGIRWSSAIRWSPAIRWSIRSMDFDKLKVYGDTFISDGLVYWELDRFWIVAQTWSKNLAPCLFPNSLAASVATKATFATFWSWRQSEQKQKFVVCKTRPRYHPPKELLTKIRGHNFEKRHRGGSDNRDWQLFREEWRWTQRSTDLLASPPITLINTW